MAQASSYPKGTPKITDTVVGVQYEEMKDPAVKQFTITDIAALIPTTVTPIPEPLYKVYTALLEQSMTDTPTATVLENTIGDISFEYYSPGLYSIVSDGLFTFEKTIFFTVNGDNGVTVNININYSDVNTLFIFSESAGNRSNNLIHFTPIEIRVYN